MPIIQIVLGWLIKVECNVSFGENGLMVVMVELDVEKL